MRKPGHDCGPARPVRGPDGTAVQVLRFPFRQRSPFLLSHFRSESNDAFHCEEERVGGNWVVVGGHHRGGFVEYGIQWCSAQVVEWNCTQPCAQRFHIFILSMASRFTAFLVEHHPLKS